MTPPPPSLPAPQGNDKTVIILCHLSVFLGVAFLLPLIIYLTSRRQSPLTAAHAAETLNFHLSMILYAVISIPLMFLLIGFLILPVLAIMTVVCAILAAIRASDGGFYYYPLTIRFIRSV